MSGQHIFVLALSMACTAALAALPLAVIISAFIGGNPYVIWSILTGAGIAYLSIRVSREYDR